MNEFRYALRRLRQSPGFSLVAILTLALAIGANSSIFSAVNALLLRQLHYQNPDRLVWVQATRQGVSRAFFSVSTLPTRASNLRPSTIGSLSRPGG